MSFGFLGIQFGFALQNANVSRIFETLGAKVDEIPILWIAAPLTGLIIQPIIGYMSDRTWGWTLEMQLRACQVGLTSVEIPVRYRERHSGTSKISGSLWGGARAAAKILWVLARHFLDRTRSLAAQ